MVVALLVRVLLSNLIKTQPNDNLPFLTTFLTLFWAGNYGNHIGKIGYDIYSTYLLFRLLLLWFLNKPTMPPLKTNHAPLLSHRLAVFVWAGKPTMGMVDSALDVRGNGNSHRLNVSSLPINPLISAISSVILCCSFFPNPCWGLAVKCTSIWLGNTAC